VYTAPTLAPLIVHTEASIGFGGQELRILAETRWLRDHGWNALIVAQPDSRLLAEAGAAGLPVVPLRMRRALDARALVALRRLLVTRRAALVHTHSSIDSWVGGLAARSLGLPVVRSRHVTIAVPRRRALVYRLAHRILTSAERVKTVLAEGGVDPGKVLAVPPGVDTTRFHPGVSGAAVRAELGLRGPVAGLVANIRGSKGHDVFLDAACAVLAVAPDARFLIVGDGVGFDDVRARVGALGLERAVIMTGFRRDIPEVMAALDVLVLPSIRSEATSQVILQALAVGTPVVATTIGGSPEVIRDGDTGRLVPPNDAHALATAILDTFNDYDGSRAMARRGQAFVRERLSVDAQMGRTTEVYRELLGTRSPAPRRVV
jgi:glycosyltransferase involved in cell wall biosynthesis